MQSVRFHISGTKADEIAPALEELQFEYQDDILADNQNGRGRIGTVTAIGLCLFGEHGPKSWHNRDRREYIERMSKMNPDCYRVINDPNYTIEIVCESSRGLTCLNLGHARSYIGVAPLKESSKYLNGTLSQFEFGQYQVCDQMDVSSGNISCFYIQALADLGAFGINEKNERDPSVRIDAFPAGPLHRHGLTPLRPIELPEYRKYVCDHISKRFIANMAPGVRTQMMQTPITICFEVTSQYGHRIANFLTTNDRLRLADAMSRDRNPIKSVCVTPSQPPSQKWIRDLVLSAFFGA